MILLKYITKIYNALQRDIFLERAIFNEDKPLNSAYQQQELQ
jgi:hypothetical protein